MKPPVKPDNSPIPPVKPDNIPNPPEGFTYAGRGGDISTFPLLEITHEVACITGEGDIWETGYAGTMESYHYAVRTNSKIHKAQPWYNAQVMEAIQPTMSLGNLMHSALALFTEEELEAELERRRQPKTITINGIEVPEPLKIKPVNIINYFVPSVYSHKLFDSFSWSGDQVDDRLFERGIVHLTKEAAIKHAEALISFTKQP
jgi:hypothetical protein